MPEATAGVKSVFARLLNWLFCWQSKLSNEERPQESALTARRAQRHECGRMLTRATDWRYPPRMTLDESPVSLAAFAETGPDRRPGNFNVRGSTLQFGNRSVQVKFNIAPHRFEKNLRKPEC